MDNLIAHRWKARDRDLNESILAVQAEMNNRGVLTSSISVKAHHEVFRSEFQAGRNTIVETIIDSLQSKKVELDRVALETWAMKRLIERRDVLDSRFRTRAKVSFHGLSNQTMIAPFMNIAQYYDHTASELSIELSNALDEYEKQFGATFMDQIVNRFKNRPLVAFGIVIFIVLYGIFRFIVFYDKMVS